MRVLKMSFIIVWKVAGLLVIPKNIMRVSQKVTYLFCDELDIVSKELRSRVRQATKDVVKSEV